LTVTNAGGSTTAQQTITVGSAVPAAPVAAFTANPTSGNAPLTVTFTNGSTGTVSSLSWDFNGDGTPDNTTDNTATFPFTTEGTYTARLTVTNAGGSDTEEVTITVSAALPNAPVASFTANPTTITAGQSVSFANTSTGTVDSLSWDFNGDGTPDDTSNQTPSFTYPTAGTFTAKLTVTNGGGSNSATQIITVGEPAPSAPVAGFNASATTVNVGDTVTFTNASTGQVDTITWNFGNGKPDVNTSDASTTFDAPGTYTVTLTVGNAGGTNTFTQQITVNAAVPAAPVAGFTAPTTVEPNVPVVFTNTSTGTVDSYEWDFDGSGNVDSTEANPTFTYTAEGPFTASLKVTNAGGSNTFSQAIEVKAAAVAPTASFTADPLTLDEGGTVTFTSTSSGTVDTFSWDVDGNAGEDNNQPSFTFTYPTAGTYTATLTVTGAGQTSTTNVQIVVNEPAATVPAGQVVYVTNGQIHIVNTDGTGDQPLTTDHQDTDIHVSGDKVVFVSDRDSAEGGQDIYLIDINNPSDVQRLTTDGANDTDPVLSPDGTQVAFVSSREGATDTNIYIMSADGSEQTLVTPDTAGSNESHPTWSPDGNFVAFVSNRDSGDGATDNDIYWVDLRDTTYATVTNLTPDDGSNDRDPAWAPDGSRIAYTSDKNGNDDIWVMQPTDGGDKQPRTDDAGASETQPSWDDTSTYILYFNNGTLYIMKDDGTEKMPLSVSTQSVSWR
jgi:PKD repeat protein